MSKITSWQHLKDALCQMKADGEDGFEGLVACLFESETGERFFVARKGDQPAGDAYSPTARTAIQAKRITRSVIRENDVEGDIDRALRETPALDVYVVAATNASNQLRLRLEEKTRETGLDIILLVLTDALSEFGALCVAHWDVIRVFFPSLDGVSDEWARTQMSITATASALTRLRSELGGIQTQNVLAKHATESLELRFRGELLGSHGHNRVVLGDAVDRLVTEDVVRMLGQQRDSGVVVLEGDEGTGKTWVAAAAANQLAREQRIPVFWLDSLAWLRAETIESLIFAALRAVLAPGDDELLRRICRKVFRRWSSPIVIILDGANERRAWESAERLLHDYDLHRTFLSARIRLLFTSRLLERRPFGGSNFWRSALVIKVGPFLAEEFQTALTAFAPDISVEDIPVSIRELALIPRYFRLSIQLRARLASISHVSKELLLWADLEAKLANRDPQWVAIQTELSGTPQQILSFLAHHARWPTDFRGVTLPRAELLRYLPGFDRVKHDLEEQRIIVSADLGEARVSADHVVLGWALVLRETAKTHVGEGSDALCDRLQKLMEPAASNDDKARAVHVAALLAFFDRSAADVGRTALLRLWALHHNAVVTPDALGFFARTDLPSYAAMVESFFREHLDGYFESTLIAPLAIMWRDGIGSQADLKSVLERWLYLIFPGDASGSWERDEVPPLQFPVATTMQQLRLSYAAISIISFRPAAELLPALVECYRSDDFTYYDAGTKEHPLRAPLKSPVESLGVLARWHYCESAIPILAQLASVLVRDGEEWKNLHWFARLWRRVDLPEELGSAKDICDYGSSRGLPPVDEFRNWLLDDPSAKPHFIGIGLLERLAVLNDQSELSAAEISALIAKVRERVAATARYRRYHSTWQERELDDLLPWLARIVPDEFNQQIRELWKTAIASDETHPRLLHLDEMLPPVDLGGELVQAILARRDCFSTPEQADGAAIPLTEAMLLHANGAELHDWFKSLETRTLTRAGGPIVSLLPLPTALEQLAPPGFDTIARREVESALENLRASPGEEDSRKRASHWLQIYAYVVEPTEEVANWALTLSETLDADQRMQFPLFHIASRCPSGEILRRTVFHSSFRQYQFGPVFHHWVNQNGKKHTSNFTFEELFERTSLTVAGRLLLRAGGDDELRAWGRALAAATMGELEKAICRTEARVQIDTNVTPDGELEGFGMQDLEKGGDGWHAVSSGVWGIDRETKRRSPTQEDYDRLCQELHEVMEARRATSRREFAEFNAVGALWRWSELDPVAFRDFAAAFLPRASAGDFEISRDFGLLADATLIALLRLDPSAAFGLSDQSTTPRKARVRTLNDSVDWTTAALWEKRLNLSPEVRAMRQHRLLTAPNDETLFWHSLCALSAENSQVIREFSNDFVSAKGARERALGVTLLAYLGENTAFETLAKLQESDPSYWIREHADWASEVCAGEIACRARYQAALESASLEILAAILAEMRMALSPLVHGWRAQIERKASRESLDKRMPAYLDLFWYNWSNTSSRKSDIKLAGRDLQKFCRGEHLGDGVTSRMAPWWVPD